MDRFGPTGKVSKKLVHLLRWTTFPGRTGRNFCWMDRARGPPQNPFFRNFSGWTEPIRCVLDGNFRNFWRPPPRASVLARKRKSTREEKVIYISDVTQYLKLFVFFIRPKNTALSWFRFDMSNLEKLWTFIRICRKLIKHGAATWRIFTRKWSSLALTPYISL